MNCFLVSSPVGPATCSSCYIALRCIALRSPLPCPSLQTANPVRTGPKTVFFWAPLMKWCLVAAGLKDWSRPAEKLSVSQNVGACRLLQQPMWQSCSCISIPHSHEHAAIVLSTTFCVNSTRRNWFHLGPLLNGHYSRQLQSGSRAFFNSCSYCWCWVSSLVQVNFFVGSTGLGQLGRIW